MSLLQGTRRFIVVSYNQCRKIYKNMQTKKYVILFQFSFIYLKTQWYMFGTKVPEFFHKVSIHWVTLHAIKNWGKKKEKIFHWGQDEHVPQDKTWSLGRTCPHWSSPFLKIDHWGLGPWSQVHHEPLALCRSFQHLQTKIIA